MHAGIRNETGQKEKAGVGGRFSNRNFCCLDLLEGVGLVRIGHPPPFAKKGVYQHDPAGLKQEITYRLT
jgi:hypothetical protein